jgi:hypothetical protein
MHNTSVSGCNLDSDVPNMINAGQMRAARAFLGLDQRALAEQASLSPPSSAWRPPTGVRGRIDPPIKLANPLAASGIELNAPSIIRSRGVLFVS